MKSSDLHAGLIRKAPVGVDKSMRPPSMSNTVNNDTTRSSTQPNQKALGPREA